MSLYFIFTSSDIVNYYRGALISVLSGSWLFPCYWGPGLSDCRLSQPRRGRGQSSRPWWRRQKYLLIFTTLLCLRLLTSKSPQTWPCQEPCLWTGKSWELDQSVEEKLKAAKKGGLKKIFLPEDNKEDVRRCDIIVYSEWILKF